MTSGTLPSTSAGPTRDDPLRVELRVDLPDDAGCAVADVDGEVTGVSQHLKGNDCGCQPDYLECHTEVTLDEGGDVRYEYLQSQAESGCVCRVFERTDCIPEIRSVDGRTMTVSLILPNRSVLRDIVEQLRATGAKVRLQRAVREDGGDPNTIELEAREITPKQREAIEVAVDEGYYEQPREIDLEQLADRLDVSKSAVSQRLNAVESKLVQSLTADRS